MATVSRPSQPQVSPDRPIPIALINLGGLLPIDLQELANKLNHIKNQQLFIFHPIAKHVELSGRDLPHGYTLKKLFTTISNSLIGTGYSFGIGITHEVLEFARFNWHDVNQGVGVITLDHSEAHNPVGRTLYQYLAYLVLCEALCISGKTQFEHPDRFYCLFDECTERDDLKICLLNPYIHCKYRLKNAGFTDLDIESAEAVLIFVKTRRFTVVLQETFSKWYVGIIGGILITNIANFFFQLPLPWNIGLISFLLLIIIIFIGMQYMH